MELEKIEEQERVLSSYNQNLVVSASAGSGKTSVMIRKIIDLILNKNLHVKDLLVLTYTNSAANEMKQKLINAINEKAQENPKLLSEIDDIPLADISTFDSFCQKLVKKYFYVLGIDPGFNIVQGTKQVELQNKSLKNAIKAYKQKNIEAYYNLFNAYASNRTDKNIYSLILTLYNYTCSILDYNEFKQTSLSLFDGTVNKASLFLHNNFKQNLFEIKKYLDTLLVQCNQMEYKKYCRYINKLSSCAEQLLKANTFENLIECANGLDLGREVAREGDDEVYKPQITALKEWLKSIITQIKKYVSPEIYKKSITFCKQIVETLFELCDLFIKEYTSIKKRQNFYDYNDIERLTICLLENEEVLSVIKANYKQIFIDEFQDANMVQEAIITYLKGEDNLFLVGDLKQAIYGFRQSNSKIFERICKQYEEENKTTGKSNSLYLNCNFRSAKNILNFINDIFSVIMTQNTANLDYKGKAKLMPKAKYEDETPSVELNILYSEKTEKSLAKGVYSVVANKNNNLVGEQKAEAQFVAERITKLLEEQIYDINIKKFRKVNYSDICILFRTRSSQNNFIEVFNKYKIPVVENSKQDLEQTYDIKVLINLIKIAQNYKNDYALSSVMMSNLFCFDANEMLLIRNCGDYKYFYECVKNYNNNDEIQEKIKNMFDLVEKFYDVAIFDGLDKALLFILGQTKYEYKLNFESNSFTRKKNIKDYINSFAGTNYNFNISDYLNFLQNSTRQQKVVSEVLSYDAVTLTTMHASKGLEWPIVFCVSLGDNFNKMPQTSEIALNEELGVGVKYYNDETRKKYDTVFFNAITLKNKENDFGEKLRLLYVALTRAKNRLILVGQTSKLDFIKLEYAQNIKNAQSYLQLIVGALDGDDISKINNGIEKFNIKKDENYLCRVINQDKLLFLSPTNDILPEYVLDDVSSLVEYIKKPYFNNGATKIAQKNSVSSLLKQDNYSNYNHSPESLTIDEHLKDTKKDELGLLYHKMLEILDLSKQVELSDVNYAINYIKQNHLFDVSLLDKNLVIKNAEILRDLAKDGKQIKEHSFVMQIPYNEIVNSDISDNVLVQGICDLIILRQDKTILVDYKFSDLTEDRLINKYNKQLYLYKKAVEYAFNTHVEEYILSLKTGNLIKIEAHK